MALDGAPHTVVGVLAEGFYFPRPDAEVWTPWVMPSFLLPGPGGRPPTAVLAFDALGRLRPGVSPERAATEVRTILQRIDNDFLRAHPQDATTTPPGRRPPAVDARVIPLQEADGRRVPAGAAGADRGGGPGAAHRVQQRGGAAARARSDAPARAGPPRGPGRGPRPGRAPVADRERGAGSGRRPGRARRGRGGAPRGAGAWSRAYVARLHEAGQSTASCSRSPSGCRSSSGWRSGPRRRSSGRAESRGHSE